MHFIIPGHTCGNEYFVISFYIEGQIQGMSAFATAATADNEYFGVHGYISYTM
jgi:hypothetical protein